MIVLGLDTATAATAVGLRLSDGSTIEARDDPLPDARPGHITRLLPLAEELLAQAALGWNAIERIAVGVGPGTFTGLRIGVASARGLAHSLGVEIVGVSTPRALAVAVFAGEAAVELSVLAVIDARRGEVFAGAYGREGELLEVGAMAPAALPELLTQADKERRQGEGVGESHRSAGQRWIAVGDGALRYREQLDLTDLDIPPADSGLHRVSGAAICELGSRSQPMPDVAILPDYCRRADAELALEAAKR